MYVYIANIVSGRTGDPLESKIVSVSVSPHEAAMKMIRELSEFRILRQMGLSEYLAHKGQMNKCLYYDTLDEVLEECDESTSEDEWIEKAVGALQREVKYLKVDEIEPFLREICDSECSYFTETWDIVFEKKKIVGSSELCYELINIQDTIVEGQSGWWIPGDDRAITSVSHFPERNMIVVTGHFPIYISPGTGKDNVVSTSLTPYDVPKADEEFDNVFRAEGTTVLYY